MQDSTRRSVAPRFGVNGPRSCSSRAEPSKNCRFAVTGASVTAHLSLVEAAELGNEAKPASLAAVAAVAVLPPVPPQQMQSESKARWEMVVPKMDRAKRVAQELPSGADYDYRTASIPAMPGLLTTTPAPLLSRAMAMFGMRGRSSNLQVLQLSAPSPASPAEAKGNEGREQLLAKIAKSLRGRTQESAVL